METPTSFAPLAGRLAAKVAEIRPVEGAKVSLANVMALFWCAIFEMLILLCEALDARAAVEAARFVTAPAVHNATARPVLATRSVHPAVPRTGRMLRLVQMDDASSTLPARDVVLAGPAAPHPDGHLPAGSPPWPELCWRPPRLVVSPRKAALPTRVWHAHIVTNM